METPVEPPTEEKPKPEVEVARLPKFEVDDSIPGLTKLGIHLDRGALNDWTTVQQVLDPNFSANPHSDVVKGRGALRKFVHDIVNAERTREERLKLLNRPAKAFLLEHLSRETQKPENTPADAWGALKERYGAETEKPPVPVLVSEQPTAEAARILEEGHAAFHTGVERLMAQDWFTKQAEYFDKVFAEQKVALKDVQEVVGGIHQGYDLEKSPGGNLAGAIMRDMDARVKSGKISDIPKNLVGTYKNFAEAMGVWAEKARDNRKISNEAANEIFRYRDMIEALEEPPQEAARPGEMHEYEHKDEHEKPKAPLSHEGGGGKDLVGGTGTTHVVFSKERDGITLDIKEGFPVALGEKQLQDIDPEWGKKVLKHLGKTYEDRVADRFLTAQNGVKMDVANMMTFKDVLSNPNIGSEERDAIQRQIEIIENGLVGQYGDVFKGIAEKIGNPKGLKKE